jgi:hypothetical protein
VPKFSSDEEVCVFAQNAFDDLRSRLEITGCWLDQLVRVDVMWNDMENRMVVNEVESIEADYKMSGVQQQYRKLEFKVENFITEYWKSKLDACVVH